MLGNKEGVEDGCRIRPPGRPLGCPRPERAQTRPARFVPPRATLARAGFPASNPGKTMTGSPSLRDLGWSPYFQSQLELDEIGVVEPCRVAAVHRNGVDLLDADGPRRAATDARLASDLLAVGDWLLLDPDTGRIARGCSSARPSSADAPPAPGARSS